MWKKIYLNYNIWIKQPLWTYPNSNRFYQFRPKIIHQRDNHQRLIKYLNHKFIQIFYRIIKNGSKPLAQVTMVVLLGKLRNVFFFFWISIDGCIFFHALVERETARRRPSIRCNNYILCVVIGLIILLDVEALFWLAGTLPPCGAFQNNIHFGCRFETKCSGPGHKLITKSIISY